MPATRCGDEFDCLTRVEDEAAARDHEIHASLRGAARDGVTDRDRQRVPPATYWTVTVALVAADKATCALAALPSGPLPLVKRNPTLGRGSLCRQRSLSSQ